MYVDEWGIVNKEQRDLDFWTDSQVQASIRDMLIRSNETSSQPMSRRFRIFIDGLNECSDDNDGERARRDGPLSVLEFVRDLLHSSIPAGIDVGICLSRRMLPDYGALEPQAQLIDVGSYLGGGVTNFFETQLAVAGILDDTLRYDLYQALMERSADGYEWAKLVMEKIQTAAPKLRPDELWKFVAELFNSLDKLCEKTLESIDFQSKVETLELFQLVLGSLRPLTHLELRHAFAFTKEFKYTSMEVWESEYRMPVGINFEKRLHHQSQGLIEIVSQKLGGRQPESEDEARAQVRFIHGSVKVYLLSSKGLSSLVPDFTDAHGRCHLRLFLSCVNAIRAGMDCKGDGNEFLNYAYEFWIHHAREAGILLEDQGVLTSLPIFIRKCKPTKSELLIQETIRYMRLSQAREAILIGKKRNMMLLLATMGCTSLLRHHLAKCSSCRKICTGEEKESLYFETALKNAIKGKREDTARYLLDFRYGEDVNALSPDGTTLLFTACYTGSKEVVQYLLSRRANLLIPSTSYWEFPLHAAIAKRLFHIVELLLESDACDVEEVLKAPQKATHRGWTALHVAVGAGMDLEDMNKMVKVLLAATQNKPGLLGIRDEDGNTPLCLAEKISDQS
ncbi:nacht and ankyrin domain protein [Colletotrichum chrysophilum]|uniref:Nacht and ankyrin domain protein n=1 Tax=Colletotrichum chrysophilum TaxID=1836956 RepID=A0AAD9E5X2_9PEZI|nr:nacht and ankyrin domain protein [Colletotrichum chrysophilum]